MRQATGGIPVEGFNANLRGLGRSLEGATIKSHRWEGDEYGLQVAWADGFSAFVGMGLAASSVIAEMVRVAALRVH